MVAAYGDSYLYNPRTGLDGIPFLKDVYRPFGFSANGRYFLYLKSVDRMPTFSLFVYDLIDGTDKPITTRTVFRAAWSAKGDDIAYFTMESASEFTLYVHDLGAGTSTKVDQGMLDPEWLSWSADGRQVQYAKLDPKSANYFEDGLLDRNDYRYDPSSKARVSDGIRPLLEQGADGEAFEVIQPSFDPGRTKHVHAMENGKIIVKRWNQQTDSYEVAAQGRVYAETRDGLVVRDFTPQGVAFRFIPNVGGEVQELRTLGRPSSAGTSARGERALAHAVSTFSGAWKLPFAGASQLDQGGALFSGGACDGRSCQLTSHNRALGYALDWTQRPAQGPARLLAPEEGTVAAVVTTVTCNNIQTACTNTIDAYASPCPNTGGAGNYVVLAHPDGTFTFYGHMRSFSSPVVVGQTVLPGDYLGDQGHTGSAGSSIVPCGDHLHFQRQISTAVWAQSIPTDFTELPCLLSCTTSYTSQNVDRSAPASVTSLTLFLAPSTAAAGSSSPANRVIIPSAAPVGGTLVTLSASSPDVSVPPSVLIAEGARFASFPVSVAASAPAASVTVTGQADTQTATATLTVKRIAIQSLVLNPTSVVGGNTTTANEITLSELPSQDLPISASSNKPAATVPSTVVVPAGSSTAQFPIQTTLVSVATTAAIGVSNGNSSKSSNLVVSALAPQTLTLASSSVVGGNPATATLTMNGVAGSGPAVVSITSSNPAAVVPNPVTVDTGTSQKVFTISTTLLAAPVVATITATFNGVSKTVNLTVNPLAVSSISLGSIHVVGGANIGNNSVTLNAASNPGDAFIELSSSNPAVAPVPSIIAVPAGAAQSPSFSISTTIVSVPTTVNITAAFNGTSKTIALTVNPPIYGQTVWNSYDVITQSGSPQASVADMTWQKTATVELYESTNNGGVNKGSLFATFAPGLHPAAFNRVQAYWSATGGSTYPYAGKSTVARGLDTSETNAAAPNGVFDLQLHPPNSDRLVVAAFKVPENGTYEVGNLATRRIDGTCCHTIRYRVFNAQKVQIANLQATDNRAWVADPNTYNLGQLTAGQYIYFAVTRDGVFSLDATEINWTVRQLTPVPDFTLTATPGTQSVAAGGTTSFSASAVAQNGFTGAIGFTVSGLPAGAVGDFSPTTVTDGGTTTLNIATNDAAPGTYPLTISATGNSISHVASVTLTITPAPDFTLTATPGTQSVVAGGGTSFTATAAAQNGFTGVIGFSVSGLPAGAVGDFSPATVTNGGAVTLNIATNGAAIGTYTLTISATGSSISHTASVTLTITGDFTLTATPGTQSVAAGGSTSFSAAATAQSGFTGAIGFSVTGLPAGAAGDFTPATVTDGGTTILNIATNGAAPGTYPLTISATGNSINHTASVTLTIVGPPDFTLTATPGTQSVAAGGSTSFTATATAQNGFTGSIGFSVTGLPAGAVGDFSPATVTDSGTTMLNIATNGAAPGTYSLTINASGNSINHTAGVTLTITPPPDFTLSATPGTQTVIAGAVTSFTVTATAQNGFAGTIGFSVTGLPAGAMDGFSPATLAGGGSSTLTITTGSGAAPGIYPLTITATSGTLTHTASGSLTIMAAGQSTTWNSYDVVTQAGSPQATVTDASGQKAATVELYESTNNGGVIKGNLLATFTSGAHPGVFNRVQSYWSPAGGNTYPYGGKSTVGRGLDAGETNAPAPGAVFDLQLHPPNNDHLVVAAYKVQENGTYDVRNLAVRRVDGNPNQTVRYRVFNPQSVQIANLQATSNRAWVTDANTYALGQLTAGQYIYFAVARDGTYSWDATEISWTVTKTGP